MVVEYTLIIEFDTLKITIESKSQESTLSAFLLGATMIEETQKLGYVKPELKQTIPLKKET